MNKSTISISHLNARVRELNAAFDYTNRYRLQRRHDPAAHGRVFAVVCAQGSMDRNESGWLTRRELIAWLNGFLKATDTAARRGSRGERVAGLTPGYCPDHA